MIRDHIKTVTKYPAEILLCDPKTKTIQANMRAGIVHVSVFTTDPFFRWPKTGEEWLVRQENGSWILDGILQDKEDKAQKTDLQPGDAHINASKVYLSSGTTMCRKYTEVVGNGSSTVFSISHGLNELLLHASAQLSASPYTPITGFSWTPEGPNKIKVTFTAAPASKGAQVVVIG